MTPSEFRTAGRQVIDWIADYLSRVEQYPVLSQATPGQVRASLPAHPPQQGEPFGQLLGDVERLILPGITHWQSPNFFAFFPANNSPPSILGELISAGLGVQGMLWATSPACTELETLMLDWVAEMLDLPHTFRSTGLGGGVIQDSASSATLCALLAAREKATGGSGNRLGLDRTLTCYASDQAHSSIDKDVMISGLGRENLRRLPCGVDLALQASTLEQALVADQAAGRQPCFVTASVGATATGAMDPLRSLGEVCRRHGVWLHVDAAMAGSAAICPEFRAMHDGLEWADSYCFNPHKWLMVNFDCTCFYVADRAALTSALSISPSYLRNAASDSGQVIDYRDWQIPLGRRFRALKLWFVIRSYGVQGLQEIVRRHVALARDFAQRVGDDNRFELLWDPPLNLVCFRLRADNDLNQQLLEQVNASGKMYMTSAVVDQQLVLRMSIGQTNTQQHHVQQAWRQIQDTAQKLLTTRR